MHFWLGLPLEPYYREGSLKLQSTMGEYIELIEALDEKQNLTSEGLKDARQVLFKKMGAIETQILERLDSSKLVK